MKNTLRLAPSDKHNRTLIAQNLPVFRNEPTTLEIAIRYTGEGGCDKAIPLDSFVIPEIVQAVNTRAGLLAALDECVTDSGAMAYRSHEFAIKRLEAITKIARAALEMALG